MTGRRRRGIALLLTAGLGLLVAAAGPAPSAFADPAGCAATGTDIGCMSSGNVVRDQFKGQPYRIMPAEDRPGQFVAEVRSTRGAPEWVALKGSTLDTVYEADAYKIYQTSAVASEAVPFTPGEVPVSKISLPSSVLAETVEEGATTAAAAQTAANASRGFWGTKGISVAGKLGRTAWNGFSLFSALELGLTVGTFLDGKFCSMGIQLECTVDVSPNYAINNDVVSTQAGWTAQSLTGMGYSTTGATIDYVFGWNPAVVSSLPHTAFTTPSDLPISNSVLDLSGITHEQVNPDQVTASTAVSYIYPYGTCAGATRLPSPFAAYEVAGYSYGVGTLDDKQQPAGRYTLPITSSGYNCTSARTAVGVALLAWAGTLTRVPVAEWFVPSVPSAPGGSTPNPLRYFRTTDTCSAGGNKTASSATFHETDAKYPAWPSAPACTGGGVLTHILVEELGGPSPKIVKDAEVPQAVKDFESQFPACAQSAQCDLDLLKKSTTGVYLDCYAHDGLCEGWFADPDKATKYQCRYGAAGSRSIVPLTECNVLSPRFDAEQKAKGVTEGDPRNGDIPESSKPVPGDCTVANASDPLCAGQDDPVGGGGAALPVPENCWPSGYGVFNPLAWIYQPIRCALVWALVPRVSVISSTWSSTWLVVSGKPPVSLVTALVPVVQGFTAASLAGCGTQLANFGDGLVVPCGPPGDPAWFETLYLILEVFIAGSTAFAIWREVEEGLGDRG